MDTIATQRITLKNTGIIVTILYGGVVAVFVIWCIVVQGAFSMAGDGTVWVRGPSSWTILAMGLYFVLTALSAFSGSKVRRAALFVVAAAVLASSLFDHALSRSFVGYSALALLAMWVPLAILGAFRFNLGMPNQSSEPTLASGTSPAGQKPRVP